jgi:hypothetical protein
MGQVRHALLEAAGNRRRNRVVVEGPFTELLKRIEQLLLLLSRQSIGEGTDHDHLVGLRIDTKMNRTETTVAECGRDLKTTERGHGFVEQ